MQRRNFRFLSMALIGALTLGAAACGDEVIIPPAAPTITLTPAGITLNVGGTATVSANVQNLDGATIAFTSSDATVASVSGTGTSATVTALKAGSSTITATGTLNGKSVSAGVQVTVVAAAPGVRPTITLTPTSAGISVGQQFPLVAIVMNAANPALTFRSSTPAVATVDANGVVTGVAQGNAVITALLTADTTVKAVASIAVAKIGGSAAIGISGIFTAGGAVANPANINGQISLQLNVTPGSTDSLRVFVDNTPVTSCSRNFAGTTNDNQVVTCVINTAALDANGAALFPNGQHVINARLFGNGQVAATATSEQLTFANVNSMALSITTKGVTSSGTVIGGDNMLWHEGDVVVTATPAVFTGNVGTVNAPTICLNTATQSCRTAVAVAGTNSFVATFPKANDAGTTSTTGGVKNVTRDNLVATAAQTSTSGGFSFPGGASAAIRLDNRAPDAKVVTLPAALQDNYVGIGFAFDEENLYEAGEPTDVSGSGVAKVEFFVGVNNATNAAFTDGAKFVAANPTVITSSDQLESSITNTRYLLWARVTDFAGNTSYAKLATAFGVDLDRPTLEVVEGSVVNNTVVHAGDVFLVEPTDVTSGFGDTPFEYQIIRTTSTAGAAGTQCINVNTGGASNVPTNTGKCAFVPSDSDEFELPTANGYYQINVRVSDRAGNRSDVESSFVLVDNTAPTATVSGFNLSNTAVTLTGTVKDNVDLFAFDVRLGFTGSITLPFVSRTEIGAFGLPVLGSKSVEGSTPLILSLQHGIGGTVHQVSSAGFGAYDVAENFGFGSINITSPTLGVAIDTAVHSFQVTNTVTTICAATPGKAPCGTSTSPIPATRKLTATATGNKGTFNNPFARVLFYRADLNGQAQLIGEAGAPSFTTGTTERTFTYSVTFNAAGLPHQTDAEIFAVGIDAKNQAVMTAVVEFDILGEVIPLD